MALRPPAGLHPGPRVCAAHCTCANPISDKPSVLGAAYVPGAWGTVLGGMAAICCCDGAVMVGLRPMVGARPKVGLRCMDFCLRRGTDTATGVQARAAGSCPPREGCQAVGGCARGGGGACCLHAPPPCQHCKAGAGGPRVRRRGATCPAHGERRWVRAGLRTCRPGASWCRRPLAWDPRSRGSRCPRSSTRALHAAASGCRSARRRSACAV